MMQTDNGGIGGTVEEPLVVDRLDVASVVAAFVVQKMGKAGLNQIHAVLAEKHCVVDRDLLHQALEALRGRGFLSYAKGKVGGLSVSMFKPKNILFRNPPEVMHITRSFVDSLVAGEEAQQIVGALNAREAEGSGEEKALEKMRYADYVVVRARCRGTDTWYGGQPADSERMAQLVALGPKAPAECDLRFPRDDAGQLIIPVSNIRGWFRNALRMINASSTIADYVAPVAARIDVKGSKLFQVALPIIDPSGGSGRGRGKGLTTFEALPAGFEFTLEASIPTRGFVSADRFHGFLILAGRNAPRGLSNGRSGTAGRFEVLGFEVVARAKDEALMLAGVLGDLSLEARENAEALMEKLGAAKA